jgi:hypothetical protein
MEFGHAVYICSSPQERELYLTSYPLGQQTTYLVLDLLNEPGALAALNETLYHTLDLKIENLEGEIAPEERNKEYVLAELLLSPTQDSESICSLSSEELRQKLLELRLRGKSVVKSVSLRRFSSMLSSNATLTKPRETRLTRVFIIDDELAQDVKIEQSEEPLRVFISSYGDLKLIKMSFVESEIQDVFEFSAKLKDTAANAKTLFESFKGDANLSGETLTPSHELGFKNLRLFGFLRRRESWWQIKRNIEDLEKASVLKTEYAGFSNPALSKTAEKLSKLEVPILVSRGQVNLRRGTEGVEWIATVELHVWTVGSRRVNLGIWYTITRSGRYEESGFNDRWDDPTDPSEYGTESDLQLVSSKLGPIVRDLIRETEEGGPYW